MHNGSLNEDQHTQEAERDRSRSQEGEPRVSALQEAVGKARARLAASRSSATAAPALPLPRRYTLATTARASSAAAPPCEWLFRGTTARASSAAAPESSTTAAASTTAPALSSVPAVAALPQVRSPSAVAALPLLCFFCDLPIESKRTLAPNRCKWFSYHQNCFDWARHQRMEKRSGRSASIREQLSSGISRGQIPGKSIARCYLGEGMADSDAESE